MPGCAYRFEGFRIDDFAVRAVELRDSLHVGQGRRDELHHVRVAEPGKRVHEPDRLDQGQVAAEGDAVIDPRPAVGVRRAERRSTRTRGAGEGAKGQFERLGGRKADWKWESRFTGIDRQCVRSLAAPRASVLPKHAEDDVCIFRFLATVAEPKDLHPRLLVILRHVGDFLGLRTGDGCDEVELRRRAQSVQFRSVSRPPLPSLSFEERAPTSPSLSRRSEGG